MIFIRMLLYSHLMLGKCYYICGNVIYMKESRVKIVTYIGIVSIVFLQLIWLFNTYTLTCNDVIEKSNDLLSKAIDREAFSRLNTIAIPPEGEIIAGSPIDATMDLSLDMLQESLLQMGSEMSLSDVDSIYTVLLDKINIKTKTALIVTNKDNKIIKSTIPNEDISNSMKIFKTNPISIYSDNSLSVQGIIVNPYWVILKRMGLILLATIIMMIFVCWCIVYQIKVIIVERRVAQWKDTFSKAMIHDMKTPIAGIKLSTHILRTIKPEETKEHDEMLSYIERENEHLYALANKVLTIAKVEENKIILKKHEFELHPVIEDLVEKFKQRTRKQVDFNLNIGAETAYGEEEYIKEAISNLIDNAIKYSGENVKITIAAKIEEDMLCISVEDNGFGISREDRKLIFEKFERGAKVLKQGVSGFGLGLNYVKHVAELHGGRADMMSRKGYGSVFMIMIPTKTNEKYEN